MAPGVPSAGAGADAAARARGGAISAITLGDVPRRLFGSDAFLIWQVPAAVVAYALYLGMTFPEDAPLLWIAEQALNASDYHHDDSRATWPC